MLAHLNTQSAALLGPITSYFCYLSDDGDDLKRRRIKKSSTRCPRAASCTPTGNRAWHGLYLLSTVRQPAGQIGPARCKFRILRYVRSWTSRPASDDDANIETRAVCATACSREGSAFRAFPLPPPTSPTHDLFQLTYIAQLAVGIAQSCEGDLMRLGGYRHTTARCRPGGSLSASRPVRCIALEGMWCCTANLMGSCAGRGCMGVNIVVHYSLPPPCMAIQPTPPTMPHGQHATAF